MQRFKIAHLTFNMDIGGAEQVIRNLIEGTDLSRFDPSVLCLESKLGPIGEKLRDRGFHVTTLDRTAGFDTRLVRAIKRYIDQNDIHILHCHQYTPYSYGVIASLFSNTRVIFTEHGRFYPEVYKWKRILINPFLGWNTDAITSISAATKDALVKYERLPRKRIEVIYNGIKDYSCLDFELEQLRKSIGIGGSDRVLGTISRLDPIKNQRLMLEAFKAIRTRFPHTKLVIVGDGPLREELEEYARSLDIERDTVFTGFQMDPYIFVKLIDIFLLPSLSEGTSMTLLEAMSFSKPCVVTDVGGNPEIVIDGETGFVTPDRDVMRFAESIINLLENEILIERLGAAARARYEQYFTVEKMVDTYQKLYLQVAGYSHTY